MRRKKKASSPRVVFCVFQVCSRHRYWRLPPPPRPAPRPRRRFSRPAKKQPPLRPSRLPRQQLPRRCFQESSVASVRPPRRAARRALSRPNSRLPMLPRGRFAPRSRYSSSPCRGGRAPVRCPMYSPSVRPACPSLGVPGSCRQVH